jgi:hypothetical protein
LSPRRRTRSMCKRILNYVDQGEARTYLVSDFNPC